MNTNITAGSLFLEGLLSFFTPCVLPLIPLYLGYLTKDAVSEDAEGNRTYRQSKVFFLTVGFVLGICTVFAIMGMGAGLLQPLAQKYSLLFSLVGSFLLLILGMNGLGILRIPLLDRTLQKTGAVTGSLTFFRAYLLGFFFSFAWSPCTGPMLAQALLLAVSAESASAGWLYIGSYCAGFILMFIVLGIFTSAALNFLKKARNIVRYTEKIAGAAILCMGIWMFTSAYREIEARTAQAPAEAASPEAEETAAQQEGTAAETDDRDIAEYGFTLAKADGTEVSLGDYDGTTVVVNFFGTWCTYCNMELPGLQQIHETDPDVKILLIAAPGFNGEGDIGYVEDYMHNNGYTMDILYDSDGKVTDLYHVTGYPCTYILRPDGSFLGYVPGYVPDEDLKGYIETAKTPGQE